MKLYLNKILSGQYLSTAEAQDALLQIGSGSVSDIQISALLMGIQQRGISVHELIGFRAAMLEMCISIDLAEFNAMDVCGTGGDGKDTFNISTTSAFVIAGTGQKVAKHGNHGLSSPVGSSTVLEFLGVEFTNDESKIKSKLDKAGICYMHAPLFHPAMKYVGPVRKALGIKTFFNILGPLLNPAKVTKQITGVSDLATFDLYKGLYGQSKGDFGVLHALDGYDEISLTGDFKLATVSRDAIYSPADLQLPICKERELYGGDTVEFAAEILKNVLQNKGTAAQQNVVLANAAVGLHVASGINMIDAKAMAMESIESGEAYKCLQKLVE